ncbi:unnamed protein product [Diabrotica balteata]|uniref:Uncharacterized protein n=1 Tax=Diabrotica balteata TaxID=107213 RepID=A0A9N9XKU8_DIABA|nr:unnamed protein product [Diabrotica balteata]
MDDYKNALKAKLLNTQPKKLKKDGKKKTEVRNDIDKEPKDLTNRNMFPSAQIKMRLMSPSTSPATSPTMSNSSSPTPPAVSYNKITGIPCKYNRQKLKGEEFKHHFEQTMNEQIRDNIKQVYNVPTVEERYDNIRNIIDTATQSRTVTH